MRLLFSFILSSFFLIASLHGNAREISEQQLTNNIKNETSAKELIDYTINNDFNSAVNLINHGRGSTKSRFYSYTNVVNTFTSVIRTERYPKDKYFVHPYLYCKSIGLKLIFPQHYYW